MKELSIIYGCCISNGIRMSSNKRCFVIMLFSQTSDIHTGNYWDAFFSSFIKPNVEKVGYNCKRSSAEPGNIIKGVINELINSDILAVLTDFNPNVWYELGIRHARKNGTIMMIERTQRLPFDINQYGVIEYDDTITAAAKFEQDLRSFIQKIESQKPVDSPAMDFLKEYEKDSLKQKELSIQQKVYEEKLEKIYEFIQQLQQDHATPSSKSKEHRYDLENIRVLWVDDNPSNNEAIMDIYRLQGVKFDLAINSSQALDFIAAKDYNLVISDRGRGWERDAGLMLLREIKFRIANPPPIFIFASDKAVEKFGETARREGATLVTDSIRELTLKMNDVLIKPTVVGIEKLDIRDESVDT